MTSLNDVCRELDFLTEQRFLTYFGYLTESEVIEFEKKMAENIFASIVSSHSSLIDKFHNCLVSIRCCDYCGNMRK